jgi:hypothetical protein
MPGDQAFLSRAAQEESMPIARHFALLICLGVFAAAPALRGAVIIQHSGANNPSGLGGEGFTLNSAANSYAVTDDLGISGLDAWHLDGSRDSTQENYHFTGPDIAALSGAWLITANLRNLSTASGAGTGPWVTLMLSGVRFDIGLESDGNGNQVLEAKYDGTSASYTISGLGQNFALIQVAYDPVGKTADYYYNGTKVISGYAGASNWFYNGLVFGADNGNFNLVELETGGLPDSVPEPVTAGFMIAALAVGAVLRLRRSSASRQ